MGQKNSTPYRVIMLGLDSAGKTSTLYRLKNLEPTSLLPTVGYNVETVKYKNILMNVWDIGGQVSLRPLWRRYFLGTEAIIFVVDSTDSDRFQEAKNILHDTLEANELKGCDLLIYANKQDLQYAVKPTELTDALGLHDIDRSWYVQPSCATTGNGLEEGLRWLLTQFREKASKK